jgi:hypothetical protein
VDQAQPLLLLAVRELPGEPLMPGYEPAQEPGQITALLKT